MQFFFPVANCHLGWAPRGQVGSLLHCRTEIMGNTAVSCARSEYGWHCARTVTGIEAPISRESFPACGSRVNDAGLVQFDC